MPASGWHIDANYAGQLSPPTGVQIHALFGDVAPRSGASQVLSGSHRLIASAAERRAISRRAARALRRVRLLRVRSGWTGATCTRLPRLALHVTGPIGFSCFTPEDEELGLARCRAACGRLFRGHYVRRLGLVEARGDHRRRKLSLPEERAGQLQPHRVGVLRARARSKLPGQQWSHRPARWRSVGRYRELHLDLRRLPVRNDLYGYQRHSRSVARLHGHPHPYAVVLPVLLLSLRGVRCA